MISEVLVPSTRIELVHLSILEFESKKEEKLNDLQIFARKTVSKGTIKEVASKVESASSKMKPNGLQCGGWITAIILAVVALIIIGLIIYFKRKK